MKLSALIKELHRVANECGRPLIEEKDHHGIRLSTPCCSIRLGSDQRQEVHRRHHKRYFKQLGLPTISLG